MATTLNASSSSGLITTADTSTVLQLQTNGTAALTIDASANVGIGTASPAQKLHVASAGGTYMQVQNTTASIISYFGTSTAGGVAQVAGAYPFSIFTNGSERLTVDSSGNVGIGTASPSALLDVYKAAQGGTSTFRAYGPAGQILWANSGASTSYLDSDTTIFRQSSASGNAERMRIDSSGNVGIGVTPSAWGSTAKAVQLPNGCAIANLGAGDVVVTQNAYFDNPNFKYAATTGVGSSAYRQIDGTHRWSYSASGTAGNNITFSEAMRIDTGGRLLVGTTSSVIGKMTVSGGIDSIGYPQFNIYSTNSSTDFEWVLRSGQRQLYYVNNATVVASLSLTGVWTNASDARYKENITNSQYGLATVMALKPRAYNLIDQADKPQVGFIAQEVLDVVPEVVDSVHNSVTDEDRYTLSYGNMVAVLTKAIQEQQAIITSLTDRITALEGAK